MGLLHDLGITLPLLVTQIIGFLILMALLNRFMFKPLFGILDERRADIQRTYDQLDADREAMQRTREEYEQRLANIEAEARERIQAAVKEAQALRDNLVADAQARAESILAQGQRDSAQEREKAFLEMRGQIVALAVSAAGKVVGESLNDARHTKLADDFITQVGSGAIAETGRGVSANTIGSNGTGAKVY